MKGLLSVTVLLSTLFTFQCCLGGYAQGQVWKIDSGEGIQVQPNTEILAQPYPQALMIRAGTKFLLKRKWTYFEAEVGMDDAAGANQDNTANFYVDGKQVKSIVIQSYKKPSTITVPVSDCMEMVIRYDDNYGGEIRWINPRFVSGAQRTGGAGSGTPSASGFYTVPIDPRGIAALAEGLKKQIAEDERLRNSVPVQLAVCKFKLIPDPSKGTLSPTVADNVLEDLSTELIKSRAFMLVERAQLGQILEELKINETTGLIDSATAMKLGNMAGAKAVLVGSISDRGGRAVINCRLINTQTGAATIAEQVGLSSAPENKGTENAESRNENQKLRERIAQLSERLAQLEKENSNSGNPPPKNSWTGVFSVKGNGTATVHYDWGDGNPTIKTVDFKNYMVCSGLMLPCTLTVTLNGKSITRQLENKDKANYYCFDFSGN